MRINLHIMKIYKLTATSFTKNKKTTNQKNAHLKYAFIRPVVHIKVSIDLLNVYKCIGNFVVTVIVYRRVLIAKTILSRKWL